MKPENSALKILNSINTPIVLINRDYVVVEANRAASAQLRHAVGEVVGSYCFSATHGFDEPCWNHEGVSCPLREVFETGRPAVALHKHEVAGRVVVEELLATPLDEEGEEINYVVEEFRDITKLLELREGFLPICASCKKIRDEVGGWHDIEAYIRDHTGADFSHSVCPECCRRLYPELVEE